MVTLFHNMMHKQIEVYISDMIAKTRLREDHVDTLKLLFNWLYKFKLRQPCKVTSRKLLEFIVRRKGIEVDPAKFKVI